MYEYSLEEFIYKLHRSRQIDNIGFKDRWDQIRELAWLIAQVSGNLKKGLTKYHIMQFGWDEIKPRKGIGQLKGDEQKEAVKALLENAQNVWSNYMNSKN